MRPTVTESSPERIGRRDDVADGGALEVFVDRAGESTSVLLLRRGDEVRAFLNVCPHAGRALNWAPGRFLIDSGLLICAAHGASFEIPGGACVGGPCRGSSLHALPLQVVDGELLLSKAD